MHLCLFFCWSFSFLSVILQLHIANACLLFHPSRASPPPLFQQPLSLSRPSVSPEGCGGMVELWKTMSKQGHGEFLGKSYTNTVLIHTTTVQSKCVKTVEVVKLIKFVVWPRSNFRIISHMGEWDVSKTENFGHAQTNILHSSCLCGHRSILAKKCTWITMLSLRCLMFSCVIFCWLQSNCGKSPHWISSLNDISYFSVLRTARLASPVHHCGNFFTFQLPKLFQSNYALPGLTLTVRPLFQASGSPTILMRGFCYQSFG